MKQERGDDQLAVANLVHDDAADDDAETEAGEPGAPDRTELRAGEPEIGGPGGKDAAADAETDAGGENGEKPGPQKAHRVRRDRAGSNSSVAHEVLSLLVYG